MCEVRCKRRSMYHLKLSRRNEGEVNCFVKLVLIIRLTLQLLDWTSNSDLGSMWTFTCTPFMPLLGYCLCADTLLSLLVLVIVLTTVHFVVLSFTWCYNAIQAVNSDRRMFVNQFRQLVKPVPLKENKRYRRQTLMSRLEFKPCIAG